VLSAVEWTLGWRILEKARWEYLNAADYSTSIVFAAMAIEAELARMYFKWRGIDVLHGMIAGLRPLAADRLSDEELNEEYRSLGRTIAEKIDTVARLLDPRGIDEFAKTSDLREQIAEGFPSLALGSLAADIQQTVFWPRNRIVHAGYLDHTAEDAKRVCNVASLVLELLKRMDRARTPRPSPS
jgi:hypothetical protein